MKRLLLVRHGATESNTSGKMRGWSDDSLDELGVRQATQTAEYLKNSESKRQIEKIYTSTLPRSIETGNIIAAALNVEVEALDDLRELNLGQLEGKSEKELWDYFVGNAMANVESAQQSQMKDVVFPDGEAVSTFLTRIEKALRTIAGKHPQGQLLIVWHGVAAMVALGKWLEPSITLWPKFRLDNCSITELTFDPMPHVVRLNDTSHLQEGA